MSAMKILEINASARRADAVSRRLSQDLVDALRQREGRIELTRRDLANGVPYVDEDWVDANATTEELRTGAQRASLAESDRLVAELKAADVLIVATPMYNFGVPATLKAWVDMIARARVTFRYTENGPVGLLVGKKAYVIVATGGVGVDSPVDFATPYLRQALSFVGIDDVDVVAADRLGLGADGAIDNARARIAELVHAGTPPSRKVA